MVSSVTADRYLARSSLALLSVGARPGPRQLRRTAPVGREAFVCGPIGYPAPRPLLVLRTHCEDIRTRHVVHRLGGYSLAFGCFLAHFQVRGAPSGDRSRRHCRVGARKLAGKVGLLVHCPTGKPAGPVRARSLLAVKL